MRTATGMPWAVQLLPQPKWPSGKASASRARGQGVEARYLRSNHAGDFKIDALVATLPGA